MTRRSLTSLERSLAASMFGDAIDLDRVAIHLARWWSFQPKNAIMAPDGDIWCHPQGHLHRACYASGSLAMQALFLHEMTHVWQAQRGGRWYLPLMRHPFCRYAYRLMPGKRFTHYGIEQQAEIVADAFLLRNGVGRRGKPGVEVYEALLPFVAPAEAGAARDTRHAQPYSGPGLRRGDE
ncbi:vgr related protein [Sphingomonas sp. SRS2]|uniref:vgr related protein n=1 Tax=Sphingomonas sp. SRS2 TaxID=133190 RepID=UPI000A659353|nr:vgr related protein [Sphingomonas sp. SRS2]